MTNTVVPSHMTTFVTMKNSMYQNSSLIKEVAFDRFYRGGGGFCNTIYKNVKQ